MAQAMSGVMSVTGYPDGPPVKAGVPVADIGCALFAVYGILSAYIGKPNPVKVNLLMHRCLIQRWHSLFGIQRNTGVPELSPIS